MKRYKFCPMCSAPLFEKIKDRIECSAACGFVNYDNPTPVAAMVVEYDGHIVLAHNRAWQGDFYGLITGFVDHCEGPAECAVREVKEEVGVDVDNIRYFKSQSWPFPNQLMLGFFAEYTGGEIVCEDEEIAEAHWYQPDQLPTTPPPTSISGQLIADHVSRHSDGGGS